jgi:CBS domain-containing protein
MKASDVMSKRLICCLKSDTVQYVASVMKTYDIGAIPVVSDLESKRLEGIITDRDLCIRAVAAGSDVKTTPVGSVLSRNPVTCAPDDSLDRCEQLMSEQQVRRLPVIDAQGRCIGMLAQADIALHEAPEKFTHVLAAISVPRSTAGIVGSRANA